MTTNMVPDNESRRDTSKPPVGFVFFFAAIAIITIVVTLCVFLGWAFPVFHFISARPQFEIVHTLAWDALLSLLLIIVSFTAWLPGMIILVGIFVTFNLVLSLWYLYYHFWYHRREQRRAESEKAQDRERNSESQDQEQPKKEKEQGQEGEGSGAKPGDDKEAEKKEKPKEISPGGRWAFAKRPQRLHRTQCITILASAVTFVVAMLCLGISYGAWNVSTYYVWDRENSVPLAEIQPSTVSKSTLALYTFDGLAQEVEVNFFLVIFTQWCGSYYNETLSAADQTDRILNNYIDIYQINMSQFSPSNYLDYPTVNAFFIRNLLPNSRPVASPNNTGVLVSPADARILVVKTIPSGFSLTLKGDVYTISDIFDSDSKGALFEGGTMIIARLAPQDYHRYHAPVDGTVITRNVLGGTIFSVNADAVQSENQVFLNQRVVSIVQSPDFGLVGFVSVGATCIASIVDNFQPGSTWTRGEELGFFQYGGSTVVLFFGPNAVVVDDDLLHFSGFHVETFTKMGTQIGVAA